MNGKNWFQILTLFGILATLLSAAVMFFSRGTPHGYTPFEHYEMMASLLGGVIFIVLGVGGMLQAPDREERLGRPGRIVSDILGLGGLIALALGGIRIVETLARSDGFEQAIVLYYCIFILYGLFMLTFPVFSRLNAVSAQRA